MAAHNMLSSQSQRRPYLHVPTFWSFQFGVGIKSVGVPSYGEEVMVMQGSTDERRFVALYGHQGRTVGAVTFDQGKWLDFCREQIETGARSRSGSGTWTSQRRRGPFPPSSPTDRCRPRSPRIVRTGFSPTDREWTFKGTFKGGRR